MGLSSKGKQRLLWPCKDGHVAFGVVGGAFGAPTNRALSQWREEEGMGDDYLKNMDWNAFDMAAGTQEQFDRFIGPLSEFFSAHTKEELYDGARKRRIMLYPVSTTSDIAQDMQLASRDYWQQVHHTELNTTITYPGAFIKLSETPCRLPHCAPLIGEHNEEIYHQELSLSREELDILKQNEII